MKNPQHVINYDTNSQSYWNQNSWKVQDRVIQDVKKFNSQKSLEWAMVVGVIISIAATVAEVVTFDTIKSSWHPDLSTKIVGGGSVAGMLGLFSGFCTYKLVKCCSHPALENREAIQDFVEKDLWNIYNNDLRNLSAADLKKYWDNGTTLKMAAVNELVDEICGELNLVKENTPLISPGP